MMAIVKLSLFHVFTSTVTFKDFFKKVWINIFHSLLQGSWFKPLENMIDGCWLTYSENSMF